MKIEPLFDQILIKPVEEAGILVAEQRPLCEYGEVLSIGDEVQKVKVGDILAFTKWGTNSVEINGTKHYFLKEDSAFILGRVFLEK